VGGFVLGVWLAEPPTAFAHRGIPLEQKSPHFAFHSKCEVENTK
jgi:hypothetical protein